MTAPVEEVTATFSKQVTQMAQTIARLTAEVEEMKAGRCSGCGENVSSYCGWCGGDE